MDFNYAITGNSSPSRPYFGNVQLRVIPRLFFDSMVPCILHLPSHDSIYFLQEEQVFNVLEFDSEFHRLHD